MRILKTVGRIAAVLILICLCVGGYFAYQGYQMYHDAEAGISLEDKVDEIRAEPGYTRLQDMPQTYLDAVVAVEDHRFYTHFGIDIIAIGRAAVNNVKALSFVEGGSTITQQLAKNLYFTQEKEITRKAAEVFAAFDLESHYTKDEILELYVNTIYFGGGYYGVAQASEGYFQKEPKDLTEDECTMLAGIPNAPSVYDPRVNPELAKQRQQQVVKQMIENGFAPAQ